jgi:ABC-type Fe3+/spermidine/putrescine transport system ATPase subunit
MKKASAGVSVVFDKVAKRFGAVQALEPISLNIRSGEFLTLLGPSGSGKTTLLNIAAGFLSLSSGQVLLDGHDVTNTPPRERNIGMVFQNYALFPNLNVFENVAYGLRARKYPSAVIGEKVIEALGIVQLDGYGHRGIHQLSGGQQQRVALARALVIEPDVLLMDEPLGALDRQLRKQVQLEIRRLHLEAPRTTISVTHDQEEALVMSDRVAIMNRGRIEQIGTPHDLYTTPKNVFVARFLGESNLLPATVLGRQDGPVSFRLDGVEGELNICQHDSIPPPGGAFLLVRPEEVTIVGDGQPSIQSKVAEIVYLGEVVAMRMILPTGQDIWMRTMGGLAQRIGDTLPIGWNRDRARLLDVHDE